MAKNNKFNSGKGVETLMVRNLDTLAAFEDFEDSVLPLLKKMIKEGKTAVDMYKAVESLAAARSITIALTEEDTGKALTALKEVLDRSGGKATERKEIRAQFSELPDADLDSLIASELEEAALSAKKH